LESMERNPVHKKWYDRLRAARNEAKQFGRKIEMVRTDEIITVFMAQKYRCGYCAKGKACIVGFKVRPVDGGNFELNNLTPICWDCWQATKV